VEWIDADIEESAISCIWILALSHIWLGEDSGITEPEPTGLAKSVFIDTLEYSPHWREIE